MIGLLRWISCLVVLGSPLHAGVSLTFRHLWNGKPLAIPGQPLLTASGEKIAFSRLDYLLSGLRLLGQRNGTAPSAWLRRKGLSLMRGWRCRRAIEWRCRGARGR